MATTKHIASPGRVWRNKKTDRTLGNKLELKSGEKITDFEQVTRPKGNAKAKPAQESETPPISTEGEKIDGNSKA